MFRNNKRGLLVNNVHISHLPTSIFYTDLKNLSSTSGRNPKDINLAVSIFCQIFFDPIQFNARVTFQIFESSLSYFYQGI